VPGQPFVDGGDADGGEVADGEFLVSAGAKSWCAARGCAVWLADLLGFAPVPRVLGKKILLDNSCRLDN
jgi:hypothetical protein